jgi:hypothetical protein
VSYHWPGRSWKQSLDKFQPGGFQIQLGTPLQPGKAYSRLVYPAAGGMKVSMTRVPRGPDSICIRSTTPRATHRPWPVRTGSERVRAAGSSDAIRSPSSTWQCNAPARVHTPAGLSPAVAKHVGRQLMHRHIRGQRRECGPIGPLEPRLGVHSAQHCDLLAEDQYFGVLRRRRSGQQRQPGQHRDSEPVDQTNLHDAPSSQVRADGRVSAGRAQRCARPTRPWSACGASSGARSLRLGWHHRGK